MGYPEKRGDYWRGRYKAEDGRYLTVVDTEGKTIKFRTRREAEQAANDAEALIRRGGRPLRAAAGVTFGEYVNDWFVRQDLALSTMQNYQGTIEHHLLPAFEESGVAALSAKDIAEWEKRERDLGYSPTSIGLWRRTLHLILADAVDEGLRDSNPATRRRGRGKRAGRSTQRGPEKKVANGLEIVLLAERAALLSGRDDEFVAVVTKGFTGLRFGELVGLEARYVRPESIRVEWQLYELDTGELHRCPPKDDSYRTVHVPGWLGSLLMGHIAHTSPKACACHGHRYAFGGYRAVNTGTRGTGPKLADVARAAGVSTGTVSNMLNRPEVVSPAARDAVTKAMADLGYVRGARTTDPAAHYRRNGFATWLFQPATTGRYPAKAPKPVRPVPVSAHPWPGVPVRGRNAAGRADACWLPLVEDFSPHGLRHSYKTLMDGLRTPSTLMDAQMGHSDGSVQARYSHVTEDMVRELTEGLTTVWENALDERWQLSPGSPVAVLDRLLRQKDRLPDFSQTAGRDKSGPVRVPAIPALACCFSGRADRI